MSGLSGDLNRYSLGDPLGTPGGYGAAFRAERDDGEACVVKLINGFRNPSPEVLRRLEVVLARLAHVQSDHVVPIIDAGIDDGQIGGRLPWLAMPELPDARSLQDLIAVGPLESLAAKRLAHDIAMGLSDLHRVGALHRDVKPGNILVDRDGRAWLIDFELIKILDLTTQTPRGIEPLGTTVYMAPEQFVGPVVPESDLWAFGLVIIEMLTGRQPVLEHGRAGGDVRRLVLASHLIPEGLPEGWRELVSVLLRKLPAARPSDARELAQWIRAPQGPPPAPAAVSGSPPFRWAIRSVEDVDGAEFAAAHALSAFALDVDGPAIAHVRRLYRVARTMGAALSLDAPVSTVEQLSIEDVTEGTAALGGELDRYVISHLRAQRDSPADVALLPWRAINEVGISDAIHTLRVGLRNRHLVGGRPVIATVQCPLGAVTDERRVLEFAAALTALDPDGWRLLVDGMDPGCGDSAISAVMELAGALASCADVWVRASTMARWALACQPGVSVLYRSGRGLWTHGGRKGGRSQPERVEIATLKGPIPRRVAERLAVARPDLLHCVCTECRGCALPTAGPRTVAHNVWVVAGQLAELRALAPRERRSRAREQLTQARFLRASLSPLIGWDGELGEVDALIRVLDGKVRSRGRKTRLVEFA
jgi:Protein kinase domain